MVGLNPGGFERLLSGSRVPIIYLSSILFLIGCGGTSISMSSVSGHYEDMSPDEAAVILSKNPQAVPEYAPSEKVIVGSDLVSDRGFRNKSIPKAILEAGAELIIIGSQMTDRGLDSFEFKDFSKSMNMYKPKIKVIASSMPMFPSSWARDWAPIGATGKDNTRILLDFNYYNERPTDDFAPSLIAQEAPAFKRLSVPMYLEGGNFLITSDGKCLTTTRIVEANDTTEKSYIVDAQGIVIGEEGSAPLMNNQKIVKGVRYFDRDVTPRVRTDETKLSTKEITQLLQQSAGCKSVFVFPKMPQEGTGHIDMWAKALNDKVMILGEIDAKAIANLQDKKLQAVAKEVGQYLDNRADDLTQVGFQVVRIPMPLPHFKSGARKVIGEIEYGFRSYTNSLLVVTPTKRIALVPRYVKGWDRRVTETNTFDYPDQQNLKNMESKVESVYSKAGFKVQWIEADELLAYGGAVHCATMQVPLSQ